MVQVKMSQELQIVLKFLHITYIGDFNSILVLGLRGVNVIQLREKYDGTLRLIWQSRSGQSIKLFKSLYKNIIEAQSLLDLKVDILLKTWNLQCSIITTKKYFF